VAELVEATIFGSFFLWSFRCFDKLSHHRLKDHFNKILTTILSKKRLKIINSNYLTPKLVVKNTGLVKIDFRVRHPSCLSLFRSFFAEACQGKRMD